MGKLIHRIRSAIVHGLRTKAGISAISNISPYLGSAVSGAAQYATQFGVPPAIAEGAANYVIDKISEPKFARDAASFIASSLERSNQQPNAMIPPPSVADRTIAFIGDTPRAPSQPGGTIVLGTTQPKAQKYEIKKGRILFDDYIAKKAGISGKALAILGKYNEKRKSGDAQRKQFVDKQHLRELFGSDKSARQEIKRAVKMYNRTGKALTIAQNLKTTQFGDDRRIPPDSPTIATTGWYFRVQDPSQKAAPGFESVPVENLAKLPAEKTIPKQLRKPAKKKIERKFATAV